jgi:hypothetical protein
LNEDGFVMVGSLAWPHRPCIGFLSVTSQVTVHRLVFSETVKSGILRG